MRNSQDMNPVKAIVVGAGHRSMIYASYAQTHPDELQIVGVAEPDDTRRAICQEMYQIPAAHTFRTAEELAKAPRFADAIINGTMDRLHVATSLPLLDRGYAMLLEKPFACSREEADALSDCVRRNNSKVMICHVLRYSKFYEGIKRVVASGRIGDVINLQTSEDVSYHHYANSYVRGKWARSEESGTTMLLAKCCHDIDLITWMMDGVTPVSVTSAGSLSYFKPENAPADAGTRCMVDCPHVNDCHLSAKRIYLDLPHKWDFYVWPTMMDAPDAEKVAFLRDESPYGRCAYKCGNNVADRQNVLIRFENGAVCSHCLTGGSAYSKRIMRVIGTKGQIEGVFEDQSFTISTIDPEPDGDCRQEVIDLSDDCSAFVNHGGGDIALVTDFVRYVRGQQTSISCTELEGSMLGHRIIYAADLSMQNGGCPVTP